MQERRPRLLCILSTRGKKININNHCYTAVRRYAFGECYYEVTKDQCEELLDEQKDRVAEEIAALEEQVSGIKSSLTDLKSKLYGRFGKNINLEE